MASSVDKIYEVNDGVRRAKAASLAGHETIPANVGASFAVEIIPLMSVRSSPLKPVLDITDPAEQVRWLNVLRGILSGKRIKPIHVNENPASAGVPIREVSLVKNGQAVNPFTGN